MVRQDIKDLYDKFEILEKRRIFDLESKFGWDVSFHSESVRYFSLIFCRLLKKMRKYDFAELAHSLSEMCFDRREKLWVSASDDGDLPMIGDLYIHRDIAKDGVDGATPRLLRILSKTRNTLKNKREAPLEASSAAAYFMRSVDGQCVCISYRVGDVDEAVCVLFFIAKTWYNMLALLSESMHFIKDNPVWSAHEEITNNLHVLSSGRETIKALPQIVIIKNANIENLLGPIKTWMHRTLGLIKEEADFRLIMLRLLQSNLPEYAQIRHGSLEYGKDISTSFEENGVQVLRHYQVKCGDITMGNWPQCKNQLEQMFYVEIGDLQIPNKPKKIIGVLVTNGHANTYVEPLIKAWIEEQRRVHGFLIEFMHLDMLIKWIIDNKLTNELIYATKDISNKSG